MKSFIAVVNFESPENTIFVGEFDTREEAQAEADRAAEVADDKLGEAEIMLGDATGAVVSTDHWEDTIEEWVEQSMSRRRRGGAGKRPPEQR